MASVLEITAHEEQQLTDSLHALQDLSIGYPRELMKEETDMSCTVLERGKKEIVSMEPKVGSELNSCKVNTDNSPHHYGFCAICLNTIVLQETALVKGCEHAYCVTCILRWATYNKDPTCPQCKHPFEFLYIHRSLDGSIHDYMFEESACLLLRASWFNPLNVEEKEEFCDDMGYFYAYDDEEEDLDEVYFGNSSLRIGNRRWGDNGFVRSGRQEARPILRPNVSESSAGPSRQPKKKEATSGKESVSVGRRAKRALKREAADKAAAAKHQQHLVRLSRK